MRRQATNNVMTSDSGNLVPCNRVLGIPELLEQIAHHLDFDHMKDRTKLGVVCHLWRRLFEQYTWRSVTLADNNKKRIPILQNHGSLIRDLHCHCVDKTIFRSIAHHTPNLETIHLTLDRRSLWATPAHLGEVFLIPQDRLVTVSLMFDLYEVDLKWLETLKVLRSVKKVVITGSKFIDCLANICAEVPNHCPGLQDFELISGGVPADWEFDTDKEGGGTLNRLWTGVQRGMMSAVDQLPVTVRKPMGRQQLASIIPSPPPLPPSGTSDQGTSMTSTTVLVPPTTNPRGKLHEIAYPFCDMHQHNTLRRVKILDPYSYGLNFPGFARYCSNLKEIDFYCANAWVELDYWNAFAAACPQLCSLRVYFGHAKYDLGSQHVLTLFPRLELFSVSSTGFMHWSDWKSETIDDSLVRYSQDRPDSASTPLALKSLYLRTCFGTLENLLEVLSINSPLLALETLIIGHPQEFRKYSELATFPADVEGNLRRKHGYIYHHFHMTSLPWNVVMKESLTRLDISQMILVDANVVRIMFERFQELRNLQALCVCAFHLQNWVPKEFSFTLPTHTTFTNFSSFNIDNIHATSSPTTNHSSLPDISTHHYNDPSTLLRLPTVKYCFPSLQDLIVDPITPHKSAAPQGMTVSEVIYAIAAMPDLDYFYPRREGCIERGALLALRRVFPRQFMAIPEERLDWLV